ncbi:hypothetical protein F4604DRAFT_1677272 [Suillus subluteus]|nr:hypothetical protein F4604DRAFT_1677272 [Suillus subluteus]
MVKGSLTRKLTGYQCQFIEENNAPIKRRRNDDTPSNAYPDNVYHTHTSVDVTKRRPVTRTSYFRTLLTPDQPSSVQEMSIQPEMFTPDFNVDEAYLDFLVDTSTDTIPAKTKRQRTAGMSLKSNGCQNTINFSRSSFGLKGAGTTRGVEIWTGNYFQHGGLRDLGLHVQLGHPTGVRCCNPSTAFQDDFTVLDTTGIHSIMLDFCNCKTAQTHATQLLHAHWYPATVKNPCTAATFHVLDHFQMYTFESKGSVFEYYQSLACLMDNIRRHQTKVGRPVRSNIMSLKAFRWLYGLFLAIDANFCLCRRNKSSEEVNPSLSKGWGCFVEETGFKYVLDAHAGQVQDKSSCASHNTVNLADTKNSRGLATTGIGAIVCAHHNLTRPSSVGDLQRGERYVNMDYLFFSTLRHSSDVLILNISYDIACQWRMARTDGEAIEHRWSNMNPVATSTREMGPGSRHDILDDHFGDWNWHKVSNLGPSLLKKLKEVIPEHNQHAVDLRDFEEAIPSSSLSSWQKMVEEWEDDRLRPNPFEVQASAVTQSSVRLELSQLEAHQLRQGINDSLHPDIFPMVKAKIAATVTKYQVAWKALDALANSLLRLDWQIEFPKLKEQDIRGMTEAQAGGELESEGQQLVAVSWIWKQHHGAGKEELSEAMYVEWCKAQACANRWAEEVELVQEEM